MIRLVSCFVKDFVFHDLLDALRGLVSGDHVSYCRLPCKTTQTQTKFVYETKDEGISGIDIFFNSKVRVTKTDLVWPTFTNFLSEVILKTYLICRENKNQQIISGWWLNGSLAGSWSSSNV